MLTGVLPRTEVVRILNESRLFVLASIHERRDAVLWQRGADRGPAVGASYDWKVVAARDDGLYRALVRSAASDAGGHGGAS